MRHAVVKRDVTIKRTEKTMTKSDSMCRGRMNDRRLRMDGNS